MLSAAPAFGVPPEPMVIVTPAYPYRGAVSSIGIFRQLHQNLVANTAEKTLVTHPVNFRGLPDDQDFAVAIHAKTSKNQATKT